jgi:hypothetical protein
MGGDQVRTIVCSAIAIAGCARYDDSPSQDVPPDSIDRFASISVAFDEGYDVDLRTDYYVPEKGIELANPALVELHALRPQSVIYEFDQPLCDSSMSIECPDRGYRMVGVRYTQPAIDGEPPPMLEGQVFTGPVGDPPVWELYRWVVDNPNGEFASTNPNILVPPWWPSLFETWKAMSERYPTPNDAIADNYENFVAQLVNGIYTPCVFNPFGTGGMGYHYVLLPAIRHEPESVSPLTPQGLVYQLKADGTWVLGAIEWFLWASPGGPHPDIEGFPFDGPMPPHGPGQAEHYDLHAYIGYLNPDGLWTKWNRRVGCPYSP